nr:AsmA family protein [uncultured Pseudodesulfovibrio sp.]
MRVAIKRLLLLLMELCVVLLFGATIALFWASYYIDTDEFRTTFTQKLSVILDRKVELAGDLNIVAWPDLALEVDGLTVHEAADFGTGLAAEFDTIRIMVEVLPLFSKQLQIESVVVEGMRGTILYGENGQFNWQTVLDSAVGQNKGNYSSLLDGWVLSVESVEIADAEIVYRDVSTQSEYRLSGIDLRTGMFRPGQDVPFSVSSDFTWAEQSLTSALTLKGVLRVSSDGSDVTLKNSSVYGTVSGDILPEGVAPGELTAYLDVDWKNRSVGLRGLQVLFLGLRAEGNLKSGDLREGFFAEGHVTVHPFTPSELIAQHVPSLPVDTVDGLASAAMTTFVRVSEKGISFEDLALTLDDLIVRGKLDIIGYTKPVFNFSLRSNTLELDRYLPLFVTDTPFVWNDFNLNFFKKIEGKGLVRADGLKVIGANISDIRLKVSAHNSKISFVAESARHNLTSLTGSMDVTLGSSSQKNVPTLAIETLIKAHSSKDGFTLLQRSPFFVGGAGKCIFSASVAPMECPPKERSISILRNLKSSVGFSLGRGVSRYKDASGRTRALHYSKADVNVSVVPAQGTSDTEWNNIVDATVKTRGGEKIETFSLIAQGPLTLGIDSGEVRSSGMAINGHVTSSLLPKQAKRATANGTVAFDSEKGTLKVSEGFVRVLETSITGLVQLTDLNEKFKGKGNVSISGANPKRVVYLLVGKALRTKDSKALTKAVLNTRFTVDEEGFVLSELRGELDGMAIKGHVAGAGFKNPVLAFTLTAGDFDLDRYLPPSHKPNSRTGKLPEAKPVKLPLEFLRALRLSGKATFDSFTLADIRATRLVGRVRADNGDIHVSKVQGQLHGGSLTGDWTGLVSEISLSTDLVLDVKNMQAGPLLKDMAKRDYIRGETDVDIDLKSRGATDDDILANLQGTTKIRVANGSFKFTGYSLKPEQISAKRSTDTVGQEAQQKHLPRTPFQKAIIDLSAKKGIFNVDKLRVEAPPVLQSSGEGHFNLPDNTIDIAIRNDFVVVPSVTIKLVGKLTDPQVKIPTGKIVHDTVFNILSIPKTSFEFLRDLF